MKVLGFAFVGLAALSAPAFAQTGSGRGEGSPRYDPAAEATVKGTVDEVKTGPLGVQLILRTDVETLEVRLGPPWFLEMVGLAVAKGEDLEIKGSRAKLQERQVFLAREVKRGRHTHTLRDAHGLPLWTGGPWD